MYSDGTPIGGRSKGNKWKDALLYFTSLLSVALLATVIWLGELTAADSKATMQNTLCRLLTGAGAPYGEWPVWRDVLDRSWFRRRWVLQEYALSCDKVFMIGDLMMPASDFMACIWKVGLRDEYEDLTKVSELPAAGRVIETPIEAAMEKSLLSRLHQFSSAENSHPLDCVYALHSISAERPVSATRI